MAAPFHQSLDAHEDSDIVGPQKTTEDNADANHDDCAEQTEDVANKSNKAPFVSTATLIKDRYISHIDRDTVPASRTDDDFVTDTLDKVDTIESVGKSVGLLRHVAPETAKKQRDTRLAAAKMSFDMSILKTDPAKVQTPPVAANNNNVSFKETESTHLLEQLNRTTFEPDETKRRKYIGTYHRIRELTDTAGADGLGLSVHRPGKEATPDHDLERMESGKVWYEPGQTLDRRGRTYDYRDNEIDAKRFDGPVRTAKRSPGAVSNGFDVNRNDPFAQRRIDAQMDLEDFAAAAGPVWLPFLKAVFENGGFTDIGTARGFKHAQASAVGSATVRYALDAPIAVIEAKHHAISFLQFVQDHNIPIAARRHLRALQEVQSGKIVA